MQKMEIVYLSPHELTPYENNTRKHNPEDIDGIKKSILDVGFRDPIGIWGKDNLIVEGHGRQIAALELGLEKVPCIRLDDMTEEQRKEYAIRHNRSAEMSAWDFRKLEEELAALAIAGVDMSDLKFEEEDFGDEAETAEPVEDNFEPEPPEEPRSKLGDIYQLGRHRLMCGDSTSKADVEALCDGAQMDLLLTDPPYNVDYEGGTKDKLKIMNDKMEDAAFRAFLVDAFQSADLVMRPGAAFYIWHADSEGLNFRAACKEAGWEVRECLIWNKNSFVLGRQDYQWKHEPCLYGWKDGAGHYFIDVRNLPTVMEDGRPDIAKMKKEEMAELLREIYDDKVPTTVINENKPSRSELHPTMKPIKLVGRQIQNSTKRGWNVLDLFGGSGSTLIACEQLNRDCYMMELDPHYVDVIIKRWEDFTGQKAVLINE